MLKRTRIVVASMPKSGSTYLAGVIANLPGFKSVSLVPKHGAREQEIDSLKLFQNLHRNFVAQMHLRRSEWTEKLARRYNLKLIVLTRDISDVVISLRDHVRRESHIWPMFHLTEADAERPDAELETMLAHLATPWLLNFQQGWAGFEDALHLTYEQATTETLETLEKVARFSGLELDRDVLAQAIGAADPSGLRKNVGSSGRGKQMCEEAQEAVRRLSALYG